MKILGLTGSIGMGKSAVTAMFRRAGVPVFDADAAVHVLQGPDGALLPAIEARFPGTTGPAGVDRVKLGAAVFGRPDELKALERIVHPAVARMRARWIRSHRSKPVVVLDIPLLYETQAEGRLDGVIVVSAPAWLQRARALRRPGMTAERLAAVLALQTPDAMKRRRADAVVTSAQGVARTRRDLARAVERLQRCAPRCWKPGWH